VDQLVTLLFLGHNFCTQNSSKSFKYQKTQFLA